MLGGPPPVPRDSQPPPSHYPPPATSASSGPTFAPSIQASPRMHSASSEYQPFRRPQTPEHARPYDPRGSAAASPQGAYSTTPEMQRYGTPQAYHQRGPSAQDGRDPSRMPPGPPPRPTSQPKSFASMPPRPVDMGRNNGPEEMKFRVGSLRRSVALLSTESKGRGHRGSPSHLSSNPEFRTTLLAFIRDTTNILPPQRQATRIKAILRRLLSTRSRLQEIAFPHRVIPNSLLPVNNKRLRSNPSILLSDSE
ncbi:histone deacetylation protein Rxt3 [Colletotrichum sp. SAR 10_99]|nr:histone deacetylation protein Rxt3 [Colletotrichum sp. SAR 10_96]KAI8265322.1 histone deacetylation protein Rxt3 [Colletotrichum sp. SAR 10_98]KAJ5016137.1 histone deacetylation protein Rxt3 [Colletotrichum sp. SAR 10_99]